MGGNLSDVTLWKGSAADTIAPEEAAKARGFYEWPLARREDGVEFAQAGTDQWLVPAYSAMLWKLSLTRA